MIHGLSPKCRVYDLIYLRCKDLEVEKPGLLRELNQQVQGFIRKMESGDMPVLL